MEVHLNYIDTTRKGMLITDEVIDDVPRLSRYSLNMFIHLTFKDRKEYDFLMSLTDYRDFLQDVNRDNLKIALVIINNIKE